MNCNLYYNNTILYTFFVTLLIINCLCCYFSLLFKIFFVTFSLQVIFSLQNMKQENNIPPHLNWTHDRLQAEFFKHLRNTYPQYRKLYFAVINETGPVGRETPQQTAIRANRMKTLGLEPGVFDLLLYFDGVLHAFDFKVGNDRLSDEQLRFKAQIESQGGKCYEVRSLQEGISLLQAILQ